MAVLNTEGIQLIQATREVEIEAIRLRQSIDYLLAAFEEWFLPASQERLHQLAKDCERVGSLVHDVPRNWLAKAAESARPPTT